MASLGHDTSGGRGGGGGGNKVKDNVMASLGHDTSLTGV